MVRLTIPLDPTNVALCTLSLYGIRAKVGRKIGRFTNRMRTAEAKVFKFFFGVEGVHSNVIYYYCRLNLLLNLF